MVKVLYFARLREELGCAAEEVALPPAVGDVRALTMQLAARGGAWGALATGFNLRVAVNQQVADASTPVKSGDEVAFFPPVTGG